VNSVRTAGTALVAVLALAGCSDGDDGDGSAAAASRPALSSSRSGSTSAPTSPDPTTPPPSAPSSATASSSSESPLSSLPPGDPGTGDVTVAPPEYAEPSPRTSVPARAMLNVEALDAISGDRWTRVRPARDPCRTPVPPGALGTRSLGWVTSGATVTETVATYRTQPAAERGRKRLAAALQGCGWTPERAPRLGQGSSQLGQDGPNGRQTVTVLTAEGVAVVLAGTGTATPSDPWDAFLDVALGGSCAATADGCH
jgi:hypothetical protein